MMETEAGDPAGARIAVDVLGPLRLTIDGGDVDVPGPKRRAVLALLAMASPEPVSFDSLVDAVWPTELPAAARQALQSHVSRIRRHLGPAADRLTSSSSAGYRLALQPEELDAATAERLVARGRSLAASDPHAALGALREARGLWRGPALEEFVDVAPLTAWARSLAELRLEACDALVESAIAAGETADAVVVASETVASDPLRESAVLGLMRALASAGRSVEALRAGHDYRNRLAEESGLEPTAALGELEHTIAGGDVVHPDRAPVAMAAPEPVPSPPSGLIGREAELAGVARLIDSERIVTIVGPGGVGKTHLALETARHARSRRAVAFVELAPVTDAAVIPDVLATALGLRGVTGDLVAACAEWLRSGPHLLVVDNCEHLLDPAGRLVAALSAACPDLTILATSRERLGVPAEQTCRLSPLPVPAPERSGDLGTVPSVALFVERARRVRADFAPSVDDWDEVADIVRRLDGMPLAIELAAGRLSSLDVRDLEARLDRALDLLGRAPSSEGRHRTLRSAIEWSYELLPDDERRLFRNLAVFPDGFDLATAEDVARDLCCAAEPATALAHLVDASMLVASFDEAPRYRMLDTLRSFGLDQLAAEGEHEPADARLRAWAVRVTEWLDVTAGTEHEAGADARLRRELANLRAAWRATRSAGDLDRAVTIVVSLDEIAAWRELTEIWGWARELADDPDVCDHPRAAAVLGTAANATWMGTGDLDGAERLARRGLDLAGADEDGRIRCLVALSDVANFRGDHDRAREIALAVGDDGVRPGASAFAALAAAYGGDLDEARVLVDGAIATAESPTSRGFSRYVAGEIDGIAGDWATAESHYRAALDLAACSGATFVSGIASVGFVSMLARSGQVDTALVGFRDLIGYWEQRGSWTQQWTTLRNLAALLDNIGDDETAAFLRSAADHAPEAAALGGGAGTELTSIAVPIAFEREVVLDVARAAIDRQLSGLLGGRAWKVLVPPADE